MHTGLFTYTLLLLIPTHALAPLSPCLMLNIFHCYCLLACLLYLLYVLPLLICKHASKQQHAVCGATDAADVSASCPITDVSLPSCSWLLGVEPQLVQQPTSALVHGLHYISQSILHCCKQFTPYTRAGLDCCTCCAQIPDSLSCLW